MKVRKTLLSSDKHLEYVLNIVVIGLCSLVIFICMFGRMI